MEGPAIHELHRKMMSVMLLKFDFEKAHDKVKTFHNRHLE